MMKWFQLKKNRNSTDTNRFVCRLVIWVYFLYTSILCLSSSCCFLHLFPVAVNVSLGSFSLSDSRFWGYTDCKALWGKHRNMWFDPYTANKTALAFICYVLLCMIYILYCFYIKQCLNLFRLDLPMNNVLFYVMSCEQKPKEPTTVKALLCSQIRA